MIGAFSINKSLNTQLITILIGMVFVINLYSPIIFKNAFAITAEEMLEDPILEKRAQIGRAHV